MAADKKRNKRTDEKPIREELLAWISTDNNSPKN